MNPSKAVPRYESCIKPKCYIQSYRTPYDKMQLESSMHYAKEADTLPPCAPLADNALLANNFTN